jgi:hypothetical protein
LEQPGDERRTNQYPDDEACEAIPPFGGGLSSRRNAGKSAIVKALWL